MLFTLEKLRKKKNEEVRKISELSAVLTFKFHTVKYEEKLTKI